MFTKKEIYEEIVDATSRKNIYEKSYGKKFKERLPTRRTLSHTKFDDENWDWLYRCHKFIRHEIEQSFYSIDEGQYYQYLKDLYPRCHPCAYYWSCNDVNSALNRIGCSKLMYSQKTLELIRA